MTREEAIMQIENRWSIMDYGESEALGEALDMAIEALEQEPKREKWEHYLKEGLKWKCSGCGSRYTVPWSYCPNCGARMGSDEE